MAKGLAQKRHHKKRLKNRRKRDIFYTKGSPINKHVITPKLCSCWLCSSPRKFSGNGKQGMTIQELRQADKQKEIGYES